MRKGGFYEEYEELITYVYQDNKGLGGARNTGMQYVDTPYLTFLDSDDIWYPNKVAKQLELMKKRNCPFSYTAIEMIDENDNLLKNKRQEAQLLHWVELVPEILQTLGHCLRRK